MRENDNCIAIYSRKSKFTGKGESIGNQIELCKEFIRVHYSDAALDNVLIFEDEGFSGGNLNRPSFKKMLQAAHQHKFKAIIVYRLDRISRNISDFSTLIEELARLKIDFISIREQFDTGTPMGRAMMYIASVFSQLERETIAERIRDNMHELAKTGRWLGGMTPTGYASQSVKSVTVDGKTKKACHLKLIPEEAALVKAVFEIFSATESLTNTEAELMRRRLTTKNGKQFTRFAIKGILQNPVYLIADQDAYQYFVDKESDLFSDVKDFDGAHGILAYNRTDQEKGRATVFLPPEEWIISVGNHPGLIPGKAWVRVQEALERNKSKSFRRPRSNKALLTGLIYCSCGARMHPKLSKRVTADGQPSCTYVCRIKEHSHRSLCNKRNANGNALDAAVIEHLKALTGDRNDFVEQLASSRRFYTGNRTEYENHLSALRQEKGELEKKIGALVDSLVDLGDGSAKAHVARRIDQLHLECRTIESRIQEFLGLTPEHALSEREFDVLRDLLTTFRSRIEDMTVEEKRSAVRALVRKVVWDGKYAHIILFGSAEDEIECSGRCVPPADAGGAVETPEAVLHAAEKDEACAKTHWGAHSKRDPDVLPRGAQIGGRCFAQ